MTIEEALFLKLSTTPAITSLLGAVTLPADGVYPAPLPQEIDNPKISFQRIDSPRFYSHSGFSNLATPRFQIDCWALNYEDAYAVANAVRQSLCGVGPTSWGTVQVYACFAVDERDSYEGDSRSFRRSLDLQIHHQET